MRSFVKNVLQSIFPHNTKGLKLSDILGLIEQQLSILTTPTFIIIDNIHNIKTSVIKSIFSWPYICSSCTKKNSSSLLIIGVSHRIDLQYELNFDEKHSRLLKYISFPNYTSQEIFDITMRSLSLILNPLKTTSNTSNPYEVTSGNNKNLLFEESALRYIASKVAMGYNGDYNVVINWIDRTILNYLKSLELELFHIHNNDEADDCTKLTTVSKFEKITQFSLRHVLDAINQTPFENSLRLMDVVDGPSESSTHPDHISLNFIMKASSLSNPDSVAMIEKAKIHLDSYSPTYRQMITSLPLYQKRIFIVASYLLSESQNQDEQGINLYEVYTFFKKWFSSTESSEFLNMCVLLSNHPFFQLIRTNNHSMSSSILKDYKVIIDVL
eukprot:TRINITY_DN3218_c0_g1_i3.p1 TRINITY_DN3218_c0_g1~~TRINITY_DN3218_c0_g1_i3.p1  ORF type:complete len:384 (+),score=45.90 TRINITY_DN3218_c0_g1_i3:362-1513(+)